MNSDVRPSATSTQVLIVGGGPVGLTLAMLLASRGIDVLVAETRYAGEPPTVKCNHVSARSMEMFRQLGLAATIRSHGLPEDYPNDIVYRTTLTGPELTRIPIPCRSERYTCKEGPDTWWPTPEPPHRINQIYMEPLLFARAAALPHLRISNRTQFESFTQSDTGVTATRRDFGTGESFLVAADYLVGCDGARSAVRRQMGAELTGTPVIQRVQSTYIRAPDLLARIPGKPAWSASALNPRRCGTMIAIDGRERWLIHNHLYPDEGDFDAIDRDASIRTILGVGPDFEYEVLSKEDWVGRRLVADRFRDRRVFIAGDAAHLWMPYAGYGMNAGIADAANLAWLLAAVLEGWAAPAMLDAYEAERKPITEQVSQFAMDIALRLMAARRAVPKEIEAPGPEGDATRRRIGQEAYDLNVQQYCCGGLNFGYFYDASPIIAYDGEPPPAYTMYDFTPSTVPGCRVPHRWLGDGRSLYDELGPGFTLLRLDPAIEIAGLVDAAARRRVPLRVLDLPPDDSPAENSALDTHKLVLVRPDQHVAWRGDASPPSPLDLIDRLRGAG